MEQKQNKSPEKVKLSKEALFELIASQVKDKCLFPKQVEEARKMLERARFKVKL